VPGRTRSLRAPVGWTGLVVRVACVGQLVEQQQQARDQSLDVHLFLPDRRDPDLVLRHVTSFRLLQLRRGDLHRGRAELSVM